MGRFLAILAVVLGGRAFAQVESYDCLLEPSKTAKIAGSVAGVLDKVFVEQGDYVKRGQVLAKLEASVQEAVVEIHRVYSSSNASIKAQEAHVQFSKKRFERANVLWEKNLMPQSQLEELAAELRLAESELARVRVEHRIAALEYRKAILELEQMTIRSPIGGVVSRSGSSVGEFMREDGHLVTISQLHPLDVVLFLPVAMYPQVQMGMTAIVEPAYPVSGTFLAKVKAIDRVFDPASGSFEIRLELANQDGKIPAGHRCTISLERLQVRGELGVVVEPGY